MRIESAWTTERELLESTLAGLRERAVVEEEKSELARAKTAREREEMEGLRTRATAARRDLAASEERLKAIHLRLVQLRPSLPPRLSDALEMAFRSLARPDIGPGERMQLTMTVLNRCAQFNSTITCGEDVLAMAPGEAPVAVTVIYWGLSHAYAVERKTNRAWSGRPGAGNWSWQLHPELAGSIERLIAIYTDKADPAFVSVPASIAHRSAAHPVR